MHYRSIPISTGILWIHWSVLKFIGVKLKVSQSDLFVLLHVGFSIVLFHWSPNFEAISMPPYVLIMVVTKEYGI